MNVYSEALLTIQLLTEVDDLYNNGKYEALENWLDEKLSRAQLQIQQDLALLESFTCD